MVVENARGQVVDSATRELTIPDFTKVEVSFGTPRVFRARTVRDVQNVRNNPAAQPVVDRTFSRAERILVRLEAYAPGGSTPTIAARLLNRTGQPVADLPMQPASGGQAELELALGSLAAGDYLIEFTATAAGGTAQELVAFKVSR
jgi:hypothetical protein